ncbi:MULTISPECIES: hypothetical protein [unclassified Pseudonocardia]|nr:hypothetical protein [Pseudonocardia sp. Ae707_Ps1]
MSSRTSFRWSGSNSSNAPDRAAARKINESGRNTGPAINTPDGSLTTHR